MKQTRIEIFGPRWVLLTSGPLTALGLLLIVGFYASGLSLPPTLPGAIFVLILALTTVIRGGRAAVPHLGLFLVTMTGLFYWWGMLGMPARRYELTALEIEQLLTYVVAGTGLIVLLDPLQRRQIDNARRLRESELRYRTLVEQGPVGIIVHQEGTVVYANAEAMRMAGAESEDQLVGQPIVRFVHPDDRDMVRARIEETLRTGTPVPAAEERLLRVDGSVFHALVTNSIIPYNGGPAVLVTGRDITTLKHTSHRLQESEERFRRLVEGAQDVVYYVHTCDHTFTYLSPSAKTVLGYEPWELIGKPYEILHTDDPINKVSIAISDDLMVLGGEDERKTGTYMVAARHKQGHTIYLEVTETSIQGLSGDTVGLQGFARDVTTRVEAERATQKAYESAVSASLAKNDFLAIMSHELRTPLTSIIGFSELLDDEDIVGKMTDAQREMVRRIEASAHHLTGLISQILDLSKLESGKLEILTEPIDLGELVHRTTTILEPQAHQKGLDLITTIPDERIIVEADPGRMRQVIINLLGNALKFTERGSVHVELRAGAPWNKWVTLSVTDTGPGIPEEFQTKIFQPFWQAETMGKREGTGLGLSITQELVTAMNGVVEVESEVGEGTVFTVRLPKYREERARGGRRLRMGAA